MTDHILLLDSSGFAYRAHYANTPRYRSDGMATHAITGFIQMIWSMLGRAESGDPYTHAVAVFDAPGRTFRHRAFDGYKADRVRPKDLTDQLPLMREAAKAMGIQAMELAGFEADDVIATLAAKARALGIRATIVSVDKDMLQLVEDDVIEIVDPVKKVRVLGADVEKRFGVPPCLMADLQALAGDDVDGIPGVPGIGPKKAAAMLRRYGSLGGVMKEIDRGIGNLFTPSIRAALKREQKNLILYRRLATLRTDAPIVVDFEDLKPRQVVVESVATFLRTLEAEHLMENIFNLRSGPVMFRRVEPVAGDPLAWWRAELRTPKKQRVPEIPQVGFYMRRLVKGGEFVPARIWQEPDIDHETGARTHLTKILCEVNGERCDPFSAWGWLCAQPITETAYQKMLKNPAKNPREAVDWDKAEI